MPLTGSPDNDIVRSIKRRLSILTATVVVFCLIVSGGVAYVVITAAKTHDALCTFRSDLITRISQSQEFLDHPETFPSLKLTPALRAQIQTQIDNQNRTVASLSGLGCGE